MTPKSVAPVSGLIKVGGGGGTGDDLLLRKTQDWDHSAEDV